MMNPSIDLRPLGFSGFSIVLIEVSVGSESVLKSPEGSHEGYWEDHDPSNKRNDEWES
jgi:hypothetical protein